MNNKYDSINDISKIERNIQALQADISDNKKYLRRQGWVLAGELLGIVMDVAVLGKLFEMHNNPASGGRVILFACIAVLAVLGADINKKIGDIKDKRKEKRINAGQLQELIAKKQAVQSVLQSAANQPIKGE